eukprot:PITA_02709
MCDVCQRTGRPSRRDEMSLYPQMTLQPFEKWAIDFVGSIQPQGKTRARNIITTMKYLTRLAEEQLVKDYTGTTTANGIVEAFNKVQKNTLTKVCNAQRSDWDLHIPMVLWAYRTTCKKLTRQTRFRLVYGVEAVMPMEYIVPSLCTAALTGMTDRRALEERLSQLDELEEERFLAGFHQQVQKQREKSMAS